MAAHFTGGRDPVAAGGERLVGNTDDVKVDVRTIGLILLPVCKARKSSDIRHGELQVFLCWVLQLIHIHF